jgi:hypothetical protein
MVPARDDPLPMDYAAWPEDAREALDVSCRSVDQKGVGQRAMALMTMRVAHYFATLDGRVPAPL